MPSFKKYPLWLHAILLPATYTVMIFLIVVKMPWIVVAKLNQFTDNIDTQL